MRRAKTWLWCAVPASKLPRNGNDRPYWMEPCPKGSVLPEGTAFSDPNPDVVREWIDRKVLEAAPARR